MEAQTFISLCIQQGIKVIPVLLPPVKTIPDEPLFLKQFHFVQLEENSENKLAFDRLEWGITGIKPKSEAESSLNLYDSEKQMSPLKLIQECDSTKILFIKNVKYPSGRWAY